jgi:predicted nucleic acid-binding protein
MAGLNEDDRIITCAIVRGEILFGILRLTEGRRRAELGQAAHEFLAALDCEPVPTRAGDIYLPLFVSQRYHRVNMRCPLRWNVARGRNHQC